MFYFDSSRNVARELEAMAKADAECKQFASEYEQHSKDAARFSTALSMVKSNLAARHHAAIDAKVQLLEFKMQEGRRKLWAA